MPRLDDILQLAKDEEVRVITRRHGVTIIAPLFLALVLMATPFFFLFPLFASGPAGIVLFIAVVGAGVVVAVRTFLMWDGDVLIVTTRRLVQSEQRGLFARTVNEAAYDNLQDVSWTKAGIFDHVFNIGRLRIRSLSGADVMNVRFVPRPRDIQQLITDVRHEAVQGRHQAPAASFFSPEKKEDALAVPMVVSRSSVSDAPLSESDEGEDEAEEKEEAVSQEDASVIAPPPAIRSLVHELAHADPKTLERVSQVLHAHTDVIPVKRAFGEGRDGLKEMDE